MMRLLQNVLKNIVFLTVLAAFFSFGEIAVAGSITLATLDWEPYIGEKLKNQGWVAELVREAFRRKGFDVQFNFMPWSRVVEQAKAGVVDGYFPEYPSLALEKLFIVSDAFPAGPLGFMKLKNKAISWKTLDDLKPYTIGVVKDYINTAEFDARTDLKKEAVSQDALNLRKLAAGRIDLAVVDKYVGLYLAKKELGNDADKLEFMSPILEEKTLVICFPRSKPGAKELATAFNEALKQIRADSTFERIMKKHDL